jgi:hypothetical protein
LEGVAQARCGRWSEVNRWMWVSIIGILMIEWTEREYLGELWGYCIQEGNLMGNLTEFGPALHLNSPCSRGMRWKFNRKSVANKHSAGIVLYTFPSRNSPRKAICQRKCFIPFSFLVAENAERAVAIRCDISLEPGGHIS